MFPDDERIPCSDLSLELSESGFLACFGTVMKTNVKEFTRDGAWFEVKTVAEKAGLLYVNGRGSPFVSR